MYLVVRFVGSPICRTVSLNTIEEEVGDTTVAVAMKVSRGTDDAKELSRIRSRSLEGFVSSFCQVCE